MERISNLLLDWFRATAKRSIREKRREQKEIEKKEKMLNRNAKGRIFTKKERAEKKRNAFRYNYLEQEIENIKKTLKGI